MPVNAAEVCEVADRKLRVQKHLLNPPEPQTGLQEGLLRL